MLGRIEMAANRNHQNERGVTIMVVAFTLVAILAMAALAVDVAELYVARGEAQRAANSGALAGAKMFVTSGFTSLQSSGAPEADITNICQNGGPGLSQAVNVQAAAAVTQNNIAGQPAVIASISCDVTNPENPRVTVSVTRAAIPTFFARIWGRTATTINATAVAEAYNPSSDSTHSIDAISIATAVKPWLVPNCDPNGPASCTSAFFVDPATGNLLNNASFIGTTINLTKITSGVGGSRNIPGLSFYPLNIPISSPTQPPVCPSCDQGSFNSYRQNIDCTSQFLMSCGQPISQSDIVKIQTGFLSNNTNTRQATQCLIHANGDGPSLGQDIIVPAAPPARMPTIQGGTANQNTSLQGVDNISRSDSIITVPLYNENTPGTPLCSGFNCSSSGHTVVSGFLQLAIIQTNATGPQLQAIILNASGCSPTSISNFGSGTPVSGSGTTPVPVRLIQNPTP